MSDEAIIEAQILAVTWLRDMAGYMLKPDQSQLAIFRKGADQSDITDTDGALVQSLYRPSQLRTQALNLSVREIINYRGTTFIQSHHDLKHRKTVM